MCFTRDRFFRYAAPCAVLLAATIARILYFVHFRESPFYDYYPKGFDQLLIFNGALEIANGNILGPLASEKQAVLYKYLLAIPLAIFGKNFTAIWVMQFGMGILTALFVYAIVRRCFNEITGLVAGLWYSFYGPAIFIEGQILRESLTCLLIALTTYSLIRISEGKKWLVLSALGLSLAMQTRPTALLIMPFTIIYLWKFVSISPSVSPDGPNPRSNPAQEPDHNPKWLMAWFVGVFAIASIPLLIRSILVHGKFVFYDQSGPFVFLLSNLPDYSGVGWEPSEMYRGIVEAHGGENGITWGIALRELWKSYGSPVDFVLLYLKKIYFTFFAYEYPSNLNYYLSVSYPQWVVRFLSFAVVSGFGLVGMCLGAFGSSKKNGRLALYAVFIGVLLSTVLFYPVDRFRILLVPLIMPFAAFTVTELPRMLAHRKVMQSLSSLVAVLALTWALAVPYWPEDRTIRPEDYANLGRAYIENPSHRNLAKAEYYLIESWNQSSRFNYPVNRAGKTLAPLERALANLNIGAGDFTTAIKRLENAVVTDPCNPENYGLMVVAYRNSGNEDKALEAEQAGKALQESLSKEENLQIANSHLKMNNLPGVYCHLLAAVTQEDDPDAKKEMAKRLTEIYFKIQTLTLKHP